VRLEEIHRNNLSIVDAKSAPVHNLIIFGVFFGMMILPAILASNTIGEIQGLMQPSKDDNDASGALMKSNDRKMVKQSAHSRNSTEREC